MVQENEAIMLLLGVSVLIFMAANRGRLARLPASRTLFVAFYALVVGATLSVLEGFWWRETLNFLEHLAYAVNAVLLLAWCWQAMARAGGQPP